MNRDNLKEYLSIAADMEKHIYLQKRVLSQLEKKRIKLGIPEDIPKPKPALPEKEQSYISIILCAILGTLSGIVGLGGLDGADSSAEKSVCWFLIILAVILFCSCLCGMKTIKEEQVVIQQSKEKHYRETNEYNQRIKEDHIRVFRELAQKRALDIQIAKLEKQISFSESTLKKIYSADIIFPKYQDFVMVCSLLEYLSSGRCTSLDGHQGAYNLLELEIRLDKIILQLDRISIQLEGIKSNQYQLYKSIQHTNQLLTSLVSSAEQVAASIGNLQASVDAQAQRVQEQLQQLYNSSELGIYCTERVQKELHYMNRMKYLCGEYDGTFDNIPPN